MQRNRILISLVVFALLLLIAAIVARHSIITNRARLVSGIVNQVTFIRNRLWVYYVEHGQPPKHLHDIGVPKSYGNVLHFSTLQGLSCTLKYKPDTASTHSVCTVVCGEPPLAEFSIGRDGEIIKEEWHKRYCLLFSGRQNSKEPMLTAIIHND